jgi:hypothetical protein
MRIWAVKISAHRIPRAPLRIGVLKVAASQDIGDVELLGILAALAVAAFIAYKVYSNAQGAASAVGSAVSSANDTATSVLTNPLTSLENEASEAWTAITDPLGDSLVGGSS